MLKMVPFEVSEYETLGLGNDISSSLVSLQYRMGIEIKSFCLLRSSAC